MPGLSASYGGPSKVIGEMCRELQRQGISVEIASTDADPHGNISVPLRQVIEINEVATRFFHSPFLQKYGFSPELATWLKQNIDQYDIVHLHAYFSYIMVAVWWCRVKHIPYIIRPLGQLDPWAYAHHPWQKRLFFWGLGRFILKDAAAIHVTSQKEYEGLSSLGFSEKCTIIPHGVDWPTDKTLATSDQLGGTIPNVLFLSRIDTKKGLPLLIQAVALLRKRGLIFTLTIAGAGDRVHENEVRALVEELLLQDIVHFVGFVSGERKEQCLTQAQLFVLPSYDENFGVAVAEAMAYGLPVVISEGVALAKEVKAADAGLVIPVGVVEPLADAIQYLLANPTVRCEMGAKARKLIQQHFTWQSVGEQLVTLYSDIQAHSVHAKPNLQVKPNLEKI